MIFALELQMHTRPSHEGRGAREINLISANFLNPGLPRVVLHRGGRNDICRPPFHPSQVIGDLGLEALTHRPRKNDGVHISDRTHPGSAERECWFVSSSTNVKSEPTRANGPTTINNRSWHHRCNERCRISSAEAVTANSVGSTLHQQFV
jgi:hypothetical protein